MQWLRVAFAFMLIFALVPAVTVMPPIASGQSYVTTTTQVTTQITTTEQYTYPVTTLYENETTSSYVGSFGPNHFSLNVCGLGARAAQEFNANAGEHLHVEWTTKSNLSVHFYITTAFAGWADQGCDSSGSAPSFSRVLFSKNGPNGSVDWVAPSTGQFVIWLFNFNLETVSGTWSLQRFFPTRVTSISYATASTVMVTNITLTTAVSQLVSQLGFPFGNLGLLGVIGAIAAIAFVLVVVRKRKQSPLVVTKQEKPGTVQVPPRTIDAIQPVTQAVQPQPTISTGYLDLDRALKGGIPEKFSVVIVSPSFDERDLLLRKVVQSALSSGRLAILVSNDIGRTEDMTSRYPHGFYALSSQADKISSPGPNLLKIPSIENLSEASISLGITLKEVVAKEKTTKPIMILDLLSDLLLRYRSITTRRWLTDFVGKRKAEGFTIIATLNPLTTTKEETESIIDFFDGVIEIFEKPIAERSRRFLMIKKMYGHRYSEDEMLMDKDKLF